MAHKRRLRTTLRHRRGGTEKDYDAGEGGNTKKLYNTQSKKFGDLVIKTYINDLYFTWLSEA